MQSKSELSKKDAAFKRDMDAMRLQLVGDITLISLHFCNL